MPLVNYDPTKVIAENVRLLLAAQVADGATRGTYVYGEPWEAQLVKTIFNQQVTPSGLSPDAIAGALDDGGYIGGMTLAGLDGLYQPLNFNLTAYANAASPEARRQLIELGQANDVTFQSVTVGDAVYAKNGLFAGDSSTQGEVRFYHDDGYVDTLTAENSTEDRTFTLPSASGALALSSEITAHAALTSAHGATDANTASRIVARNANGTFTVSGINLDTSGSATSATGVFRWNDTDKCGEIVTLDGVVVQLGQENNIYARNESGATLANGKAVVVFGASGQRMTFVLADSTISASRKTIGMVTSSSGISNNGFGFVTTFGLVRDLDTSAFVDGDELFLSTAGNYTTTKPVTDGHGVIRVGWVIRAHATQGSIFVAPHYHGTVIGDNVMNAATRAAARSAIDAASTASPSFTGGLVLGVPVLISGASTLTSSQFTILCDATMAGFSVTLPAVASNDGRVYCIKKIDATGNSVTIDGNASETIDGSATQTLDAQWESVIIQARSASGGWFILSIN